MSMDSVDAGSGRAKAKRNLFGTVDHDQIRDDLHRELKLIREEKKQKWNFDFENLQPLRGRFKWERVGKRLQTRKSPTEMSPTIAATDASCAENVREQRSMDSVQATARYNLRTRDRDLENIAGFELKQIDPSRKRLRELRASPVEYSRNTGELWQIACNLNQLCHVFYISLIVQYAERKYLSFILSFLGNCESKKIAKERKSRSSIVNVQRKTKISHHLVAKKTRR